jgi:hypothetical protein
MARTLDREKAVTLRKMGYSYTQIKEELNVSKSTLSGWLADIPLTDKRIRELRDFNQVRIEKSRQTKLKKKSLRREEVLKKVSDDIKNSKDTFFVAGFYLYWGEGTKTSEYTVALTNTDPSIIKCFIVWLESLDVPNSKLKVKLHVYSDQDENKVKLFWSKVTGVTVTNFYKTYIKESKASRKTYKGMFPHGTCVVSYSNRDTYEYVLGGVDYLKKKYSLPSRTI